MIGIESNISPEQNTIRVPFEAGDGFLGGDIRHIAMMAHENSREELLGWVQDNREVLGKHRLYADETLATTIEDDIGLPVTCFFSGLLDGDQKIATKVADGLIDILVCFWDPLDPQLHDPDVKALLRLAAMQDITVACTVASAERIISSPQLSGCDLPVRPVFPSHRYLPPELQRFVP